MVHVVLAEHQTSANHLRTVSEVFSKAPVQISSFPQTMQYLNHNLHLSNVVGFGVGYAASTAPAPPVWAGPALV